MEPANRTPENFGTLLQSGPTGSSISPLSGPVHPTLRLQQMDIHEIASTLDWSAVTVPMATPADFDAEERSLPAAYLAEAARDDFAYHNAATCPDCSAGMIRQGRCCVCPSCGFESCFH
ncbi:hypothetical protein GF377_04525 [candidate division GN15 bacterium]|nr:hypothetical protein [candidate division GN15 bacterium]